MSRDWCKDINNMHHEYGVRTWVENNPSKLKDYLQFRANFIQEELDELQNAIKTNDSEEIVDALIDICVVAIGTLDAFDVDGYKAWDEVLKANMAKEVGKKESRPNPLGLPDLIKPSDWQAPSHNLNHGLFETLEK